MYHHAKINIATSEVIMVEFKTSQLQVIIPTPVSVIVHGWHLNSEQDK